MKIVHVIPNLLKGGAERIALNICNQLASKPGYDVLLITFESANAYAFLTEHLNWKVVSADVIPSITGKSTINISELQKTIDAFEPDIIHMHLFKAIMVVSQIDYNRAHYFMHFHDNIHRLANFSPFKLFKKQMWTDLYEKRMIVRAYSKKQVTAIAISKDSSRYAQKVLPGKISVLTLPNAIDRARFLSEVSPESVHRLVMIGSLVKKKNQLLALQTIMVLKSRGVSVSLDLIGDGVMREELEQFVQQNELTEWIQFHGMIDLPEVVLRECSIYIHTAKTEAFGLVLIEAMAAALPVITTDGGGNRDLIIEGENGFIIESPSPQLIADKIEYLIKNPIKRMQMGRKAQSFSSKFDISSYVVELINLYEETQKERRS